MRLAKANEGEEGKSEAVTKFDVEETPPPLPDVDVRAGQFQKPAAIDVRKKLGSRSNRNPNDGLNHRRPTQRDEKKNGVKRWHGKARTVFVARKHRQQFVFEFRFDIGAVGQAVTVSFQLVRLPRRLRPRGPAHFAIGTGGGVVHC